MSTTHITCLCINPFAFLHLKCSITGFELYSMVPSICPLETLHNSLSLKQVDEFLTSIPESERSSGIPTTSSGRITISFFDCVNLQCLDN